MEQQTISFAAISSARSERMDARLINGQFRDGGIVGINAGKIHVFGGIVIGTTWIAELYSSLHN